jgi:hexosaminidase
MRTFFFFPVFFASLLFITAQAQTGQPPVFPVKDLALRWEVVQNGYQNKTQSLNALIITNNSHSVLPGGGWKLFFNSAGLMVPATLSGHARIELINGDLFSLVPGADFQSLQPGDSLRIEYLQNDPVVNVTDGPEGFYLVWDNYPQKGFATAKVITTPFKPSYKGWVTAAVVYDQNKIIRDIPQDQLTKIFPTPAHYQEKAGYFILSSGSNLIWDDRFAKEKEGLRQMLDMLVEKKHPATVSPDTIRLEYKADLAFEGYELEINSNTLSIRASTAAGIFYGIQSLKTLVPPGAWAKKQTSISIQNLTVQDEPRFGYRAFMLDVGRNFQGKKEIFKLLDLLALYKINVFHFHLTEDEGWRLEIPSLPELTAIGSERGHTLDSKLFLPPSHGSGPDTGKVAGSGFYSRADFIEILQYANDRHIMVLPEIETPGHARAAIKAMRARYEKFMAEGKKELAEQYLLADPKDQSVYSSNQFWNDNIMDPSLNSTYQFIQTVINEVVSMYQEAGVPLKSIHFGGDEVPEHVWEKSPAYIAFKKIHPEIVNTGDLWYYFYGRVNEMVKAKGLYLSGWEEMALRKTSLDGKSVYLPNPDFESQHLQTEVWNNTLGEGNEDLAYKLANGGYKVVLTCVTHMYFDMAYYKTFEEPGYYWGAFTDIDKPFSFIPYDYFKNATVDKEGLPLNRNIFTGKQRLTEYGKTNIVGLQSAVWGENIKNPERLEYMLLPRLLAFAERAWAEDPAWAKATDSVKSAELFSIAWSEFLNNMGKRQLPMLDYFNGGYGYRIPKPGMIVDNGQVLGNLQFPGLDLRYTTDGKDPDQHARIYTQPVPLTPQGVKLRAFDSMGRGGSIAFSTN